MTHKGSATIETKRLILRRFRPEDAPAAFRNWTSDENVTTFLRWPTHKNVATTERVIAEWIAESEQPDFYQWAIEPKEIGKPIGSIGVVSQNEKLGMLHIGYAIGSRFWHNGYTSEAFEAVIAYLFAEVGAERIESQHDPDNPRSGAVMRRCGLSYEGTLRQADFSNRGIVDACVYGILRKEWPGMPAGVRFIL